TAASHGRLELSTLARSLYLLADRWYALATAQQVVRSVVAQGTREQPSWSVAGNVELGYFFEDSWSAHVAWNGLDNMTRFRSAGAVAESNRSTQISFGLTYRPIGRFNAPGAGVSGRRTPTAL